MSTEDTTARLNRLQEEFGPSQPAGIHALSKQPSVFGGAKKLFAPSEPLEEVVPPSAAKIPPPPGSVGRVVSPSVASSMAVGGTDSPRSSKLSPVPPEFKDTTFISSPSSISAHSDFPTNDGWTDDDDIGPAVDDDVGTEFDPVPPRPQLEAKLVKKLEAPPSTPSGDCNLTTTSQTGSRKNSFSYEPPRADVLERLNSSFKTLYMDTSKRMGVSPTQIPRMPTKEKVEVFLEGEVEQKEREEKKKERKEKSGSLSETIPPEILDRFGGPSMPPISDEERIENLRILQQARAIIKGGRAKKSEEKEDILSLVKSFFPKPNSIFHGISDLPKELVSIINTRPELFCVECESPGEIAIRLCGEVTSEKLDAPKSLRRANESDLDWLKSAVSVIDPANNDLTCVSPLCFIAPRGVLISAFWGNDQGERVCYVSSLIRNLENLERVDEIRPGMPCIVRADDEYARAIVIDKATKGYQLAFLDYYETTEAAAEDIFELPEELGVDRVRCGLLLARIFEVDSVPLDCQDQIVEKIEELNSGKCTAAIIVASKVPGDLCACDIVVNDNTAWLSTIVKCFDVIVDESETQEFGLLDINNEIVERYTAGFYDFDESHEPLGLQQEVEVKEEQLVDVSYPQQQEERPAPPVVKQDELVDFSTDTVEFNPNGHSNLGSDEENRSFEAPPARSLQNAENLFNHAAQQQEQKQPIVGDYLDYIKNHIGFVKATLARLNSDNEKKQYIYEQIAQAVFLKISVIPAEADEELAAVDELIGSLQKALQ